jgi:hypothetical protein
MAGRPRPRTAGEIMAELEAKPEYAERQRQWAAQREQNRRRYMEAAAGLLADLAAAGFAVSTMADLRKRGVGDKRAVPPLLRWLPQISYPPLKRDVIATLGSPWARPLSARPLLEEFRRIEPAADPPPASIRWAIGDVLERHADVSILDDLIEIATDARHGAQRGLV